MLPIGSPPFFVEFYVASYSPFEPECDVYEGFRLFWDYKISLLDSVTRSLLAWDIGDAGIVVEDMLEDKFINFSLCVIFFHLVS